MTRDERAAKGEVVTGLLYINQEKGDMHAVAGTCSKPLNEVAYPELNPGADRLTKIMDGYR